jgi:hypothetical protein
MEVAEVYAKDAERAMFITH